MRALRSCLVDLPDQKAYSAVEGFWASLSEGDNKNLKIDVEAALTFVSVIASVVAFR
ncbi:MAG: hypothetical protein RL015_2338 [Verrucomicrobiota bacterium]|jgi:hypothetical protein